MYKTRIARDTQQCWRNKLDQKGNELINCLLFDVMAKTGAKRLRARCEMSKYRK